MPVCIAAETPLQDGMREIIKAHVQLASIALLKENLALATKEDVARLALETGSPEGFAPARRLYEDVGFTRCGPVLDYSDSEWSACFEKHLEPTTAS